MGIEKEQIDNAELPKRKVGRPITKIKKERTQAQLASDAKCRERMQKLHEQRRQNLQIKEEPKKDELPEPNEPIPERVSPRGPDRDTPELESPPKESKPQQEPEEDSSSSSDEEIIIKRKPKKKKKKKRIIYEESSESEDEPQKRKPTPPETIEKKQPELTPPKMQKEVVEPMPTFTFF